MPPGLDPLEPQVDESYIPKDLDDCYAHLKRLLKPDQIEEIRNGSEDELAELHFGLGMWIRNTWGLWGYSRLAKWFRSQGITQPDDMSGIIITSFWRHLNDKPIRLDEQIAYYQDLRDLSSDRNAYPFQSELMPETFADLEDYKDHLPVGISKTRNLDFNADGKEDILVWSTGGEEGVVKLG